MMGEIIAAIQSNFKSVQKGFQFFTHNSEVSEITPDLFYEGVFPFWVILFLKRSILYFQTALPQLTSI